MGNAAKRQRVRGGVSQHGPAARAAAARMEEEQRTVSREMARTRKALQRARERERERKRHEV
jgi:hypothetical protein